MFLKRMLHNLDLLVDLPHPDFAFTAPGNDLLTVTGGRTGCDSMDVGIIDNKHEFA
jgi:hypothetical protein